MIEDLSGPDDDDGRPPVGPALALAAPVGPRELAAIEEMHRMADYPGANEIVFTTVDDDGTETWEPPARGKLGEAERWQREMAWPVPPSIEDARAFQSYAVAKRAAEWWDRLAAARLLDEEYGFGGDLETKQKPQ